MFTAASISSTLISTSTRVLARQHAVDAGTEQERAEEEELVEQHVAQSFLARTTAPMSAPSSSMPTTSNGMMYVRNSAFVTSAVRIGRFEFDLGVVERVDQQRGEDADEEHATRRARPPEVVVERLPRMHRRARQHDPEQEQHDDRADVDEHLHPGDELLTEQDELRGATGEHDDEEQRRVHDVLRRDDADRTQRPSPPR